MEDSSEISTRETKKSVCKKLCSREKLDSKKKENGFLMRIEEPDRRRRSKSRG